MAKISISQTSAFKLCEDGSCDDPKEGVAEKIECKPGDKCKGQGCYCQLFHRDKNAKADDPWDVTPTDGAHEAKKKAEFDYKCLCVQPILPSGYTLCDIPLCKLADSQDAMDAAQVECTGDCAGSVQVRVVSSARETEKSRQEGGRDLGIRRQEWNENEARRRLLLPLLLCEVRCASARSAAPRSSFQFSEATVFAILESRNHGWRQTALFEYEP